MRIFWFMYRRIIITIMTILVLGTAIGFSIYNYNRRSDPSDEIIPTSSPTTNAISIQWDTAAITRMENEIISALQCTAAQRNPNAPIPQHDPALSVIAEESLTTLQNDLSLTPNEIFDKHEWWYLTVIFDQPQDSTGCNWATLDFGNIDFTQFDDVGVAITPPIGYAPADILIIGRKSP